MKIFIIGKKMKKLFDLMLVALLTGSLEVPIAKAWKFYSLQNVGQPHVGQPQSRQSKELDLDEKTAARFSKQSLRDPNKENLNNYFNKHKNFDLTNPELQKIIFKDGVANPQSDINDMCDILARLSDCDLGDETGMVHQRCFQSKTKPDYGNLGDGLNTISQWSDWKKDA